ncbi:hypothetical protein HBI81_156640 [Parastagonospora nodorum]|nr:hypothetical protein HBH51_220150 [Parastagonospora nodorum]KAH4804246.1 hypothetical protein HBH61_174650 [Parastagonospora nodorum]KAH4924797.1 hypothetical protein HBI79_161650 [Parastagonospora nodorum]KAH4987982.1 hypothetical protein HBI76_087230 [Parastagonospora nodorum]KAH5174272.1 hypothetical protein HBH77_207350 [Parastagonospora nodorum]
MVDVPCFQMYANRLKRLAIVLHHDVQVLARSVVPISGSKLPPASLCLHVILSNIAQSGMDTRNIHTNLPNMQPREAAFKVYCSRCFDQDLGIDRKRP